MTNEFIVVAIDPGHTGAFVLYDGKDHFQWWPMPIIKEGKNTSVVFALVHEMLTDIRQKYKGAHVYLERAMPMAMGSKHAFNYGRDFAALEIAIRLVGLPVTYVEPAKWGRVMHEGISTDLKPKAKSLMAFKRLFPKLDQSMPRNKNGNLLDGPVDALLIAAYAFRGER